MSRNCYPTVENSCWPFVMSGFILSTTFGLVMWLHEKSYVFLFCGLLGLVWCSAVWWGDVAYEGTYLGRQTTFVARNYFWGFTLFLFSEAAFFGSFFWAYFHSMVGELSAKKGWPVEGLRGFLAWSLPTLNTFLLVGSAILACLAKRYVKAYNRCYLYTPEFYKYKRNGVIAFVLSIILGVVFIFIQGYEYYVSPLTISDGCLGSTFFLLTGFHGMHVFAGLGFLSVACVRLHNCHFSKSKGFFNVKAAVAYWHFVDIVWIMLYGAVYWLSGDKEDETMQLIVSTISYVFSWAFLHDLFWFCLPYFKKFFYTFIY